MEVAKYKSKQSNHVVNVKHYKFNEELTLRRRKFGLVDIVDTLPPVHYK